MAKDEGTAAAAAAATDEEGEDDYNEFPTTRQLTGSAMGSEGFGYGSSKK